MEEEYRETVEERREYRETVREMEEYCIRGKIYMGKREGHGFPCPLMSLFKQ